MKKVISMLLVLSIICASLAFASVTANAGTTIESALSWALDIANDDSHCYVLGASHSENEGTNYDCSSFVSWALRHAGLNVPISTTYVMRQNFVPYGFEWIPWSSIGGTSNLQRGDILLDESTHVEFYYGNNQMLGAHNPNSGISVYGYYNNAYGVSWDGVLRLHEGYDPIAAWDNLSSGGSARIRVSGWAYDLDDPNASLDIHIYVGGPAGSGAPCYVVRADVYRADVNICNCRHGFDSYVDVAPIGQQEVYLYAINVGSGNNVLVGTKSINIAGNHPGGHIDTLTGGDGQIKITGWAFDKDNIDVSLNIHMYVGGPAGSGARCYSFYADKESKDVNDFYSITGKHRFDETIKISSIRGKQHVYLYAINIGAGDNQLIGEGTIRICEASDTGKNIPEGEYRIVTAINENRALDVYGSYTNDEANIQIYSNLLDKKQTFNLQYVDNGFYRIINSNSNKPIDIAGDIDLNNTNVIQYTTNGKANQEWMIIPTGNNDGYYYIIAHSNGLALDVTNALNQDGANVAVHTQNQTVAQKWKLRRVLNDEMVTVKDVTVKSLAEEISPEITVTVDDEIITQSGNYQVEITTDLAAGKGTVTVTGIDNFCDSVTKEFNITVASALLGDADGNGTVEITDATLIQRRLSNMVVPYPDETLMNADVDGDGDLSVLDATFIQRYIAKITTPYPISESIS
ncbi:MAG: RICIN domain-containing protein [Ruminococcus sp.]|nr:RICIN domain-containing protein [Ruminococcus sp.]